MGFGTAMRGGRGGRGGRDVGSAVLVLAVAVVFAALTAVATAELGVAMVQRQRAQLAADAAALAGLDGGRVAAQRLAVLNGARLVEFSRSLTVVSVEVRVGEASARARASDSP